MRIHEPAPKYDVVIVGGGMVGASFACALANASASANFSILVVESFSPDITTRVQPSFDARSTALSFGTSQIFSRIGLWQQLQDVVTPIQEIQISDMGRFGSARITSTEQRVEALGYVVENLKLGSCLNAALDTSAIVDFLCPVAIKAIKPTTSGMDLQLDSKGALYALSTELVVLADGGKSPICEQLGISRRAESYQQQALIANIAFELPHKNTAFERFTDTGPLAVLPLAAIDEQHRGSLVWTLSDAQVDEYLALPDAELKTRLQGRFGNRLGRIKHIGERFCYPLSLSVATEQIRPGLVLLGNVAHTLHPVAGQGLNLAMRDVQELVNILLLARTAAETLGSMPVLQRYLAAQQADQDRAINFTDLATRLFSSNNSAKVLSRKFGLLAIDLVPALRREFARQAMGLQSS